MDKKGTSGTEIVDLFGQANAKVDFSNEKGYKEYHDAQDKLETLHPFAEIKSHIERLQRDVNQQKEVIEELLQHKHADGEVVIPQKEISRRRSVW